MASTAWTPGHEAGTKLFGLVGYDVDKAKGDLNKLFDKVSGGALIATATDGFEEIGRKMKKHNFNPAQTREVEEYYTESMKNLVNYVQHDSDKYKDMLNVYKATTSTEAAAVTTHQTAAAADSALIV